MGGGASKRSRSRQRRSAPATPAHAPPVAASHGTETPRGGAAASPTSVEAKAALEVGPGNETSSEFLASVWAMQALVGSGGALDGVVDKGGAGAEDVARARKAIERVQRALQGVPGLSMLGPVWEVAGVVFGLCAQALANRQNCYRLARCVLVVATRLSAMDGHVLAGSKVAVEDLTKSLESARETVQRYCDRGMLAKLLFSTAHAERFVVLHRDLEAKFHVLASDVVLMGGSDYAEDERLREALRRVAGTDDPKALAALAHDEAKVEAVLAALSVSDQAVVAVVNAHADRQFQQQGSLIRRMFEQQRDAFQDIARQLAEHRHNGTQGPVGFDGETARQGCAEWSREVVEAATGGFEPSRVVGKGGFAEVFAGEVHGGSKGAALPVAVKRFLDRADADDVARQMATEAELLSALRHRHVVRLLATCAEPPCLVYELCRGGTLEERLEGKHGGLSAAARLRVLAEVAEAAAFLHSATGRAGGAKLQGVVHRDIKPDNILLTADEDDAEARLGDFGTAREESEQARVTRVVGTYVYVCPVYMRTGLVGPQTDVYAMGVTIAQVAAGCRGVDVLAALAPGGERELAADAGAGEWVAGVFEECVGLARWCMLQRDGGAARPDMRAVAAYLRALCVVVTMNQAGLLDAMLGELRKRREEALWAAVNAGQDMCECSVCGKKRSTYEVVVCSEGQHRICGSCLGPRALVLAARKAAFTEAGHLRCRECTGRACEGVLAYVDVAARLMEDGRKAEAAQFMDASRGLTDAVQGRDRGGVGEGGETGEGRVPGPQGARETSHAERVVEGGQDEDLKAAVEFIQRQSVREVLNAATGGLVRTVSKDSDNDRASLKSLPSCTVKSVAFSPDGRWGASGWDDKTVKLWDAATGELVHTLSGHSHLVKSVAFSPDGRWVASGSYDETVKLWDAATGELVHTLSGHSHLVKSVAFSPDGRWVASGSYDETVKLWDAATGELVRTLSGHSHWVKSVAFSPDGRWVASGSYDKTVKLWDAATGELVRTLSGHSYGVNSVAFSPDGRWVATVATGLYDKTVKLWDAATGELVRTLSGHSHWVKSVAFSPDGRWVASGSDDKTVKLWDAATGAEVRTLSGHSYGVKSVAFSPDGRWVASGSDDETVKLWDAATGELVRTLSGHSYGVNSVAFSPDGRWVATGSDDETVKLWDAATGELVRTLSGHSYGVKSVAFSPDGRWVASGSDDETVKLWDAATGAEVRTLSGHSYGVYSVAFSPDGRWVASGSDDETVKLWDAATGAEVRTLSGHSYGVNSVAFSPDGRWVATGSDDETVKLWDAATGAEVRTLSGHSYGVNSVAFSPDGRWVASGSYDKTVKLWDAATGELVRTLSGHSHWVKSVAFSPDGRWVASGSDAKTVKLWDAATGAEVRTLSGHSYGVNSVAFSPDGRWVACGSDDKMVKLWDAATGELVRTLSGHSHLVNSGAFSPDGQ